jgi:hypothetical protein
MEGLQMQLQPPSLQLLTEYQEIRKSLPAYSLSEFRQLMKSDNITFDEILKEFYIKTESELYRKKYIYGYNYRKETSEL